LDGNATLAFGAAQIRQSGKGRAQVDLGVAAIELELPIRSREKLAIDLAAQMFSDPKVEFPAPASVDRVQFFVSH
jgi:hypothetical protein